MERETTDVASPRPLLYPRETGSANHREIARESMKTARLEPERLDELISRFGSARIGVLGDFFLDRYLEVDPRLEEPSLETGKPAHQVVAKRSSPGAAGTVTANLAALGAGRLHAIGFRGDDGEGYELARGLERLGCSVDHLHVAADRSTPTYLKPRDAGDPSLEAEHSRYDTKNREPTPPGLEERILASFDALLSEVDAVVVLDQVEEPGCGVVTPLVREVLAARAARWTERIFWADSRRFIRDFRGVIVKPNQHEVVGRSPAPGDEAVPLEELVGAADRLRVRCGSPVVVTRGSRGILVSDPEWTVVPGLPAEGEVDPTGAGDSATAGTVLALCAGADLAEAAVVGNLVASITVEQVGTTGVARPGELPPRLLRWRARYGH